MIRFVFVLFLVGAGSVCRANPEEALINRCGTHAGSKPWTYCVTITPGSSNSRVLYYLHGGPGSAREWIDSHAKVRAAWRQLGFAPPVVVAVSFAPTFLLVEKNASPESGDFEIFLREIIPTVERDLLGGKVSGRDVFGLSMGGFNASEIVFKAPTVFRNVVLVCPMFQNLAPNASEAEIEAFIQRMRFKQWNPRWLLGQMRRVLPDTPSWLKSSPFILARKVRPSPLNPSVFLSYGDHDTFIDGDVEMSGILRQKFAHFTESVVRGNHCDFDERGAAKFLMQQQTSSR